MGKHVGLHRPVDFGRAVDSTIYRILASGMAEGVLDNTKGV